MSEAGPHLRRIRAEFERHGILSETQIAESVAFLLLTRDRWEELRDLRGDALRQLLDDLYQGVIQATPNLVAPRPLPVAQWGQDGLRELIDHLEHAIGNSPHNASLGSFFQREIRPEILKGATGPQYPTPYHVADLIAALAISGEHARVLDPTAGSAGLLVSALRYAPEAILTGYDFDPLWAALGSANLILHEAPDANFEAVSVLDPHVASDGQFDCVVMNPPFGGSRSAGEVADKVGEEYGRSNANVMAALAINALRPGGQAAFLVPSGVLFGGGSEANLRRLFADHHLEAMVTLPKSAFQPHSNIEAHMIVIHKKSAEEIGHPTEPVWFCQIERDGYPEGADRDITLGPNYEGYELPRTRELIKQCRDGGWIAQMAIEGLGEVQTILLRPGDGLPAVCIRVSGDHPDMIWEVLHLSSKVVAKIRDTQSRLLGWIALSYEGDEIQRVTHEGIADRNWHELIPAHDWADDLSQSWQAELNGLSVTLQTGGNPTLTIQRDRTRSIFTAESDQALMACLISENGDLLTPWLRLNRAREPKDIEEDFSIKYQAIPIFAASDQPAGWLIGLGTGEEGNEEEPLQRAFLVVVQQPQAQLFVDPENPNDAVLFCDSGWIHIRPAEAPSFSVEFGAKVPLRSDCKIAGFAVGPAPWMSTGYHLFGVLIPRAEFDPSQDGHGDYRPSQFLPKPEAVAVAHPLDVLAKIRKSQVGLASKIEGLSGVLGGSLDLAEDASQAIDPPPWIIAMLDERQSALWILLSGKHSNGRPSHFNLATVRLWSQELDNHFEDDEISQCLELFIALGLVVRTSVESENLYRCVKKGDVLAPKGEAE